MKCTLLLCGEGATVTQILQLLPELHDVSSFHKSMTGANKQRVTHSSRKVLTHPADEPSDLRRGLTMLWSSVF